MKPKNPHIVLRTEDLSIGYRHKNKLEVVAAEINLTLYKGELIGLVGANGIGKSTLLRTLSKVQPALRGDIFLSDKEIKAYKTSELASQLSIVLTEKIANSLLIGTSLISLL